MQVKNVVLAASVASAYAPPEPWSTLTPSSTWDCAFTEYASTFGIAVMPLASSQASSLKEAQEKASHTSCDAAAKPTANAESCKAPGTLQITLKDGVLYDSHGRIGSIVANHQFQFDGPPPQAGALLAKGWAITPDGYLALGDNDIFYQCRSGDFYNLYDEWIAEQCSPIRLEVVNLIEC